MSSVMQALQLMRLSQNSESVTVNVSVIIGKSRVAPERQLRSHTWSFKQQHCLSELVIFSSRNFNTKISRCSIGRIQRQFSATSLTTLSGSTSLWPTVYRGSEILHRQLSGTMCLPLKTQLMLLPEVQRCLNYLPSGSTVLTTCKARISRLQRIQVTTH